MIFTPFRLEHFHDLVVDRVTRPWVDAVLEGGTGNLEDDELARTLLLRGRPVACAGILPIWTGRAMAWALPGLDMPPVAWVEATREVRAILDRAATLGFRRIEASVVDGYAAGHRWMRLLGFEITGLAQCYGTDGSDHTLYARIRPAAPPPPLKRYGPPEADGAPPPALGRYG